MVPDTEVLTRAGIPSIHTLLQKAQARWAGHVTRMHADRLPKQLLYGELCYGKRSVGWQKKRFKDTLKKTLKIFNIDVTNWQILCPGSAVTPQEVIPTQDVIIAAPFTQDVINARNVITFTQDVIKPTNAKCNNPAVKCNHREM